MTEQEKINGWTFEETVKTAENLMQNEQNMFKWDVLRHLRDFAETFKEEREQYRAIGTVEELQSMKDNGAFTGVELAQLAAMQMKLKNYEAIGTVQGYEDTIKSSIDNYNLMKEYKAKVQEFEAIGTIAEFQTLKEKSVAKKPKQYEYYEHDYFCPSCGGLLAESVDDNFCLEEMAGWCPYCGQKLDWQ